MGEVGVILVFMREYPHRGQFRYVEAGATTERGVTRPAGGRL